MVYANWWAVLSDLSNWVQGLGRLFLSFTRVPSCPSGLRYGLFQGILEDGQALVGVGFGLWL